MAKQIFANGASATLAVSLIDTDVTVQVQAGYGALFPSPTGGDWFALTLEDNLANIEVMKCTARSGDLLTVVRAQEGTPAQSFTNTVTRCELRDTKGTMERFLQRSGDTLGGDLELGGFTISGPGALGPDVTVPPVTVFPIGMIVLWSGAVVAIPDEWALCDGTNGTPDLRSRFVVGAGSTYSVNDAGGAAVGNGTTNTTGAHDHGGATGGHALTESQMPAHVHGAGLGQAGVTGVFLHGTKPASAPDSISEDTQDTTVEALTDSTGGGAAHSHSITSGGDHSHTFGVATLPPYLALAYIMYVGPPP